MRKLSLLMVAAVSLSAAAVVADSPNIPNREASAEGMLHVAQRGDLAAPPRIAYEPQPTLAEGVPPMPVLAPPADAPADKPVDVVVLPASTPITLYTNVKVRDSRKVAPCAVPMLVSAKDPCDKCCQVCIEICVPPCELADIKCRRDGDVTIYDFGKHSVRVKTRLNDILVDYNN